MNKCIICNIREVTDGNILCTDCIPRRGLFLKNGVRFVWVGPTTAVREEDYIKAFTPDIQKQYIKEVEERMEKILLYGSRKTSTSIEPKGIFTEGEEEKRE